MIESIKRKPLHWAMLASLMLHVLAVLTSDYAYRLYELLVPAQESPAQETPPLELVFEEPQRTNEVVETPESARRERPNPDARLASDKNAAAQNETAPADKPVAEAFSQGLLADAESARRPDPGPQIDRQRQEATQQDRNPAKQQPSNPQYLGPSQFSRQALLGQQTPQSQQSTLESSPGRRNLESRSLDLGDFSLNTYQWDFAPYMLWLKRHVQRHIYPPPAFTHAGLISGKTRLRFRITTDGQLQILELIGFEGHKSLMETSMKAIELSAPFRGLPRDFPEPYLEVTAKFEYLIIQ